MRGGGFPERAARCLSLLLYSPGSHGGHIKWPPARAELATNLTLRRPDRESALTHGRGFLYANKGQVYFGRFFLLEFETFCSVKAYLW